MLRMRARSEASAEMVGIGTGDVDSSDLETCSDREVGQMDRGVDSDKEEVCAGPFAVGPGEGS